MKVSTEEIASLLCLQKQPGVGLISARKILAACDNKPAALQHLTAAAISNIDGVSVNAAKGWQWEDHWDWAQQQLEDCAKYGAEAITILEDDYPQRLKFIPDAPLVLFYRGNIAAANAERTIAVVGTRNITEYGKQCTHRFCEALVQAGVRVISGLAYGVDTAAHQQTMAHGGITGAVLGHGLQTLYPPNNKKLASAMLEKEGFVCTEFPFGTGPERQNFPTRNRIVVGMCDAVLVVETAVKGGSMVTASFAQQYNKDVFTVPGRITDTYSAGGLELVKHNLALVCTSPEDIFNEMAWNPMQAATQPQRKLLVDDRFESVWHHLEIPKTIDELCALTGKKQSEINALVTEMELEGWVTLLPGKRVCKA